MKRPISPALTFTPGSSTLNLSGISGFDVGSLYAVINDKTNTFVFCKSLPGFGVSAVVGTTLTLQASMAGMSASDHLTVLYDDGGKPAEDGTDATGVTMPAGGAGIRGWLSGIFSRLPGLVAGRMPVDGSGVTQPVSATALPLPAGAATETTLTAIKTALLSQADIVESLWADSTSGAYYLRRVVDTDGVTAVVWTDTSGTVASPTVANLRPLASDNALTVTNTFYDVVAADPGTTIGDVLNRIIILNKAVNPPVVAGALWVNSTTGLAIAAPTAGNYVEATRDIKITAQSAGLALDGTDATGVAPLAGGAGIRGWLSSLFGTFGTTADMAWTGSGAATIVALLKGLWTQGAATDPVATALFNAGAVVGPSNRLPVDVGTPAVTANLGTLNGAALDSSLQSILSALQAQRSETLWTDDTGAYFVRIEKAGVLTWTNVSGATVAAPGTGARPASGTSAVVDRVTYQATTAATGYSIGDILDHFVTADPATGAVIGHFWLNVTTEALLSSAPPYTNTTLIGSSSSSAGLPTSTGQKTPAGSTSVVQATGPSASSSVTAVNDAVALAVNGLNTVAVQLAAGTWTGTVAFEATMDGSNWFSVSMAPYAGGAGVSTVTNGVSGSVQVYEMACGGLASVRVRCSATMSAATAVLLVATNGLKSIRAGIRAGGKGTTAAAEITSTASGANHQAMDVVIQDGAGNVITSFGATATYNSSTPALTNGQTASLQLSSSGQLLISGPGPAATSSGLTSSRVNAAATTNATSLKATAGNIGNIDLFNVVAYDVFLKLYNKTSAPTVGTDTPIWTIPLKAGTGYSRSFPQGKFFAAGIAYAITKLQADTDTTALAAGDVTGSIDWI